MSKFRCIITAPRGVSLAKNENSPATQLGFEGLAANTMLLRKQRTCCCKSYIVIIINCNLCITGCLLISKYRIIARFRSQIKLFDRIWRNLNKHFSKSVHDTLIHHLIEVHRCEFRKKKCQKKEFIQVHLYFF